MDAAMPSPPSSPSSSRPSQTPTADRILLVDDEPDLRQLVTFNLRDAGFEVDAVGSGQAGIALAGKIRPAVVILDLMLPDLSGTEVCRTLRADPVLGDVGVLMLTARGDEYDRVLGFEVGADDYVVKPFSVRELVLRVRALVRRTAERRAARATTGGDRKLRWRGLEVDPVRHRVFIDGAEMQLRPLEFKLIHLFLEHPGRVFTRGQLLEEVWGITGDVSSRTVDTHVRRLRERLGAYGDVVETVHGFGYRLKEPT
jgi:two-component system phosphate regulon response regulator PhoB